jgi:hypothetical protein
MAQIRHPFPFRFQNTVGRAELILIQVDGRFSFNRFIHCTDPALCVKIGLISGTEGYMW